MTMSMLINNKNYLPRLQPRNREEVALELGRGPRRRRHVRQPRQNLGHHAHRARASRRRAEEERREGKEDSVQGEPSPDKPRLL